MLFPRELHAAPERVWAALTEPAQLREWAPFDADRDLATNATATLTIAGGDESARSDATIHVAERPRVLEYTWGTDVLRWELEPSADGTRLTLRHTMANREMLAKVAAGWHICLDVLDRLLTGDPVGRIVAGDAQPYWEPLNVEYEKQFE